MTNDKYTDRTRSVMKSARQTAFRMGHGYIATGHILLGLLKEQNGVGWLVLRNLILNVDPVETQVVELMREGQISAPPKTEGECELSAQALGLLQTAQAEADKIGDGYIGTEHLLLAMIRQESGIPYQALNILGVADKVEATIQELLGTGYERCTP